MIKRVLMALVLLLAAVLAPAPGASAAAPKPTAISFALQSNPVKYQTGTVANGTVFDGRTHHGLSGRQVYVFTKAHGAVHWNQTAVTTTSGTGGFRVGFKPAQNTDIKMTVSASGGYGAATSATKTLDVRAPLVSSRIEPAGSGHEGDTRRYIASTSGLLINRVVVIQTDLNGGWSTIATARIGVHGAIDISFHLRGGYRLYRLVLSDNPTLAGWIPGNNSILGQVVHPSYPAVIGLDGYGPFTMGMTLAQAETVYPALQPEGQFCASADYLDTTLVFGKADTLVYVRQGNHSVPTANGLKIGDPLSTVRKLYPGAKAFEDDPNLVVATRPGSSFTYWIDFNGNFANPDGSFPADAPVVSIALEDHEDCFD